MAVERSWFSCSLVALLATTSACAYWTDDGQGPQTPAKPAATTTDTDVEKKTPAPPPSAKTPSSESTDTPPAPPPSTSTIALKLTGSSTIGATLAPELAKAYLAHLGARDAQVATEDKAQKHFVVSGTVNDKRTALQIDYPGSGAAFDCLLAATCDIGMSSRPISSDELAKFKTPPTEHVLAMDGIAVVVNRVNKVSALSVEQIAKAFRGEITNWSQLGGAPGPLAVFGREKNSGTFESFNQLALGGRGISAPSAQLLDDNDAVSDAVAKNERGIGFVGLPYIKQTRAVAVKDGDAQPLVPSSFTVQTEDYVFSRRLYFYTTDRLSTLGGDFVDFALSDDGQKVVAQTGFVSQQVSAQPAAPAPANAPAVYSKAVANARRLSFDFRFRPATAELDVKAKRDLTRLSGYLKANATKSKVVLLGFADNQGDEARNIELSKQRAQAVSMELGKLGVAADIVDGMGSALPVSPNSTPEGRLRNRRVEVWVK